MERSQPNSPSSIRPSKRFVDKFIKPEIPYLSKRYTVAILTCLGFIISFGTQIDVPLVPYYKNFFDLIVRIHDTFIVPSMVKISSDIQTSHSGRNQAFSRNFDNKAIINSVNPHFSFGEPINDLTYFKFFPITSVNVGISFSFHKTLMTNNRRSFKVDNIKKHLIIQCNRVITLPILKCNGDSLNAAKLFDVYQKVYWNYLGSITGGILAYMCPAQKVFGIAIALQTVFNFSYALPFENCNIFETIRILQEILQFVAYVACIGIWRHWAPMQDRSCLLAISFCGTHVGIFISKYLNGIVESINNDLPIFSIYGIIGFIWFVLWTWLVFEKPRDHPSISESELKYIESSTINANSTAPLLADNPWKQMIDSKPVCALLIIYCCQIKDWVEFSKDYNCFKIHCTYYELTDNFKILSINLILTITVMLFSGLMTDIIKKRSSWTTTNIRKFFITFVASAECIFGYYHAYIQIGQNSTLSVFIGAFNLLFIASCLDVAPKYATLMMSISSIIMLTKRFLLNGIISLRYYYFSMMDLWTYTIFFMSIIFYFKLASSDKELCSDESDVNGHLTSINESVISQDYLANTNAIEMNQSNKQLQVETPSSHMRTLYRTIGQYINLEIPYFNKRYTVAILTWLGFIISFGAQTNTPLTRNEIADDFFIHEHGQLHLNQNHSAYLKLYECKKAIMNNKKTDFDYSNLKDVYWNLFGQIIGGIIAYKYPAQRVFGFAIALQTVFNFFLAIPFENCIIFEAIRMFQEILQFVAYVACIGIWRHWAPLKERPCLLAMSYCGPHIGLFIGGYLVQNLGIMSNSTNHLIIYGITGLIWYAIWTWLVFEKPHVHPSISQQELNYIESLMGKDHNTNAPSLANIPWKQMFTSKPVYALLIVNSCKVFNYCHSLSIFENNFSRESIFVNFNMGMNSNLILSSIVMLFGSFMTNIIQEYFNVSTTNVRKLFFSVDILLESIFYFFYFLENNFTKFMMLSFSGFFNLVFIISCLDVSPKYATILMSFSSAAAVITECLLSENISLTSFPRNEYDDVFFLVWITFLQFVGVILYLKLASSDTQHWCEDSNVKNQLSNVNKPVNFQENVNTSNENNLMNSDNIAQEIQSLSAESSTNQPPTYRLIDKYIKPAIPFISKRYTIAILTFFGFIVVNGMQCSMYNMTLEKIIHVHEVSVDVFNYEQNASFEKALKDYKALLEEFNYIHEKSLENKINFMYNKTKEGNYIFNQPLEEKFKKINPDLSYFYYLYGEKIDKCELEYNENVKKTNHENNTLLEEFNYTFNNSLEKKFNCIYNKSLVTFNQEYDEKLVWISDEYNRTINYMHSMIKEKECYHEYSEIIEKISRSFTVHVQLNDSIKIAELIMLYCQRSLWEKDFSVFVFGNVLAQIPGGILAYLYPAHKIFGAAIGLSSLINLCITIIYYEITPKFVILFFQGLVQGMIYPACYGIWRHWAPPFERSRLSTISFCGLFVGIVIGLPLTHVLKHSFGWKIPFYTYGVTGILWYIVWTWLTFEKPNLHPTISEQERNYIQSLLGSSSGSTTPSLFKYIPWKQMFTSQSVWAIIVADFCHMWNSVFILLILGAESNLSFSTEKFFIVIPFLFASIIILLGGVLADYLIRKSILCTTNVRKVFTCGGFMVEAFIMLISTFTSWTESAKTEICLISSITFSGLAFSGFNVNHLDIAPRYASILLGITNCISLMAVLILFPVLTYVMVIPKSLEGDIGVLQYLAFVTMCLQFVGDVFYSSCASGEQQPWAEPVSNDHMSTDITKTDGEKKLLP